MGGGDDDAALRRNARAINCATSACAGRVQRREGFVQQPERPLRHSSRASASRRLWPADR